MGNKDRGSGTHGRGNGKKGRGAGNRGGRGNAGYGKKAKHRKMEAWNEGYELGEEGFTPPGGTTDADVINLKDIDQRIDAFVEAGLAEEQDDGSYLFNAAEAGYDKVLGGGSLTKDIDVKADAFSASAEQAIEENGNDAIEA